MIADNRVVPVMDFPTQVALGRVPGYTLFNKFGDNPDLDSGTEDIWEQGGVRVLNASGGQATLVSAAAADDEGSTGAEKVIVSYLDDNYVEQEEEVTLNGVSGVTTVATDILRVNRMYVSQAGSGRVNAGAITCTVGGNVQASIPEGYGQTQQCIGTVPAGKKFYISHAVLGMGRGGAADTTFLFQIRAPGTTSSWRTVASVQMYEVAANLAGPVVVDEKYDYRMQAVTSGTNVFVTAILFGFYVDTTEFPS